MQLNNIANTYTILENSDFPNYFRYLDKNEAKDRLQLSLTSVLTRLEIPYFDQEKQIFTSI